jgi:peptidoglycan/xylan/chitin deacetylase (PgdA/CDA1 family)
MHEDYAGWMAGRERGMRRRMSPTRAPPRCGTPARPGAGGASRALRRGRRIAAVHSIKPRTSRLLDVLAAVVFAAAAVASGASSAAAAGPAGRPAPPSRPGKAVVVSHGDRTRRVVALTFDDGYNTPNCSALVNTLEATATPATFFPNAVYVAHSPALWRHVAALGFPIGNHTATHPLMTQLTFRAQLQQIRSDRTIVDRVTGRPSISVFRPPYGAWNAKTLAAAGAAGYPVVLNWDTTFADSSRRPNGKTWPVASYVRAASRGIAGSVVLGHCGSAIDLAALPAVIASYRARGFTFVTVPQLLGQPGAQPMTFPAPPAPPRVTPGLAGRPIAV